MELEWKRAIQRFLLNNLGVLTQDDIEPWLNDEIAIAPSLEPPLKAFSTYRDMILRELHQISPAEIFDRFVEEHPELVFPDKDRAIVRIGKELESLKLFLMSL